MAGMMSLYLFPQLAPSGGGVPCGQSSLTVTVVVVACWGAVSTPSPTPQACGGQHAPVPSPCWAPLVLPAPLPWSLH